MPLAVKKMLTEGEVDAVVTLGCIIEGATEHDEMIASQLTRKIMDLSLTEMLSSFYSKINSNAPTR